MQVSRKVRMTVLLASILEDIIVRPNRPTMRPHDHKVIVWWCDYMRFYLTLALTCWNWWARKRDRKIDGMTDGGMDEYTILQRCEDASSEPCRPTQAIICPKILITLVFDESVTNGRTDGRTDGPGYRDARTHLKSHQWAKIRRIVAVLPLQ